MSQRGMLDGNSIQTAMKEIETMVVTADNSILSPQLKQIFDKLMSVIHQQAETIQCLDQKLECASDDIVKNTNEVYGMNKRILELERYSRKTCLIFNSIEIYPDPTSVALNIM